MPAIGGSMLPYVVGLLAVACIVLTFNLISLAITSLMFIAKAIVKEPIKLDLTIEIWISSICVGVIVFLSLFITTL